MIFLLGQGFLQFFLVSLRNFRSGMRIFPSFADLCLRGLVRVYRGGNFRPHLYFFKFVTLLVNLLCRMAKFSSTFSVKIEISEALKLCFLCLWDPSPEAILVLFAGCKQQTHKKIPSGLWNARRYMSWFVCLEKFIPICFKFVICNPCSSSPSLTILVSFWLIFSSLVFVRLPN